jgi:hypothetical protein
MAHRNCNSLEIFFGFLKPAVRVRQEIERVFAGTTDFAVATSRLLN